MNKYNNYEELIDEIKKYNELGYYHFKIEAPSNITVNSFNLYLIFNLIKPEYQKEVIKEIGEFIK